MLQYFKNVNEGWNHDLQQSLIEINHRFTINNIHV